MAEARDRRHGYVLGVDPGTTTGLAVVRFDPGGRPDLEWADQLPWEAACSRLEFEIGRLGRAQSTGRLKAKVAPEKFQINTQTGQRGQGPAEDALGMIGVVRWIASKAKVEVAKMEQASAAKNVVSDKLLRELDLHCVGMKHATDAVRHAVLQGHKSGWMDVQLFALALR